MRYACYIKYDKNKILICIENIYICRKNIKKYNEKYLGNKIIEKCLKFNIKFLNIYSNKDVYNFMNFHDNIVNISWTNIDDNYIDYYIYKYIEKRIENKIDDIINNFT